MASHADRSSAGLRPGGLRGRWRSREPGAGALEAALADAGEGAPALILHGGRITTLDRQRPHATAVAIDHGRIVAIGGDADVLASRGADTHLVDLLGRAVLPGLCDTHTHVVGDPQAILPPDALPQGCGPRSARSRDAIGQFIHEMHRLGVTGVADAGSAIQDSPPHTASATSRDAVRVASRNPWVSLGWMVSGKTIGGLGLFPRCNCLDRETALRMWTGNVAWLSNEEGQRGRIAPGHAANLIVPSADYFAVAEDEIARLTSELTIVEGAIVHAAGRFAALDAGAQPAAAVPHNRSSGVLPKAPVREHLE